MHTVVGEGMPRKANNKEKGDLHIKFDVQFPTALKSEYKQQIIDLLSWIRLANFFKWKSEYSLSTLMHGIE